MKDIKISEQGIELIKAFKGVRLRARRTADGDIVIGMGTIVYPDQRPVKMGDRITRPQAIEFLKSDMEIVEEKLYGFCVRHHVRLTQHQIDAVLSVVYDCGLELLSVKHPFGETLRSMDSINISDAFLDQRSLDPTKGGRSRRRRKVEAHLFLTGELKFFNT